MEKYAIVIAGPSGVGKTTVADRLIEDLGTLQMSRSATTREKRGDGRDNEYIYLQKDEFLTALAEGDIVEHTEYSGNFYGTRKIELERIWDMNKNPILVLDYNGAKSLKERLDCKVFAIYVYTTLAEAKARLAAREAGTGAADGGKAVVEKRTAENLADYKKLYTMADLFDAYVENDELSNCIANAKAAIRKLEEGKEATALVDKLRITNAFKRDADTYLG